MEQFCNVTFSKQANKTPGTGTQHRQLKGAGTEAQHLPANMTGNVKSLGRDRMISPQESLLFFLNYVFRVGTILGL